jgi:thiopeptide-type bacteriocin biosynthesis protein
VKDLVPTGFFALRAPLLPLAELAALSLGLAAPGTGEEALSAAVDADRALLRGRLRAAAARPEVREAIFLASPSFSTRLDAWLAAPEIADPKIERVLYRYFARMCARPTPFGLFAGAGVGTVGGATRLRLRARGEAQKHSRLDMDFLSALAEAAARLPAIRASLIYRPNPSLTEGPAHVRVTAARREGGARAYHLVSAEPTEYLRETLGRAARGARLADLAQSLAVGEVTREDAEAYLDELVESEILVPELAPPITGPEPTAALSLELRACAGGEAWADRLDEAVRALAALDEAGLGAPPERYREVARGLAGLPAEPEIGRLFQVDLVRPGDQATLGPEVVREIERAVALLHRLAPVSDRLGAFAEAFTARFGDEEIPLLEALDEESGVAFLPQGGAAAFAEPLLDGLAFPAPASRDVAWGPREALLLRKIDEARRQRARVATLGDEDLAVLAARDPLPLPRALAVQCAVAAASEEAVRRGDFALSILSAGGPPGAGMMSRFCHADAALRAWVERHLGEEEAALPAGVVAAEIVHLPQGRTGNILLRPVLRAYEIPFLGRSGAAEERKLPASDLALRVVDGRLVLRSRRLDAEVWPRLTAAHAHHQAQNLGVYRFLCALQYRGVTPGLGFDWGPLGDAPFLPRLVHGRLVLARAAWRLGPAEIQALARAEGGARYRVAQGLREALDLPRWVALADGDQELPLDLDSALAVDTLAQLVEGRREASLVELFPGEDALCARGPEGAYAHEIIVPFLRRSAPEPARPALAAAPGREVRLHAPGSSWLYAKLYAGPATLDRVLVEVAAPVAARALSAGAADRWFFVRYRDPRPHLRLRLHGDPARLRGEVLADLVDTARPLLDAERVTTLALETYEREVDRYGGVSGIAPCEEIFCADSEAVAALVPLLLGAEGAAEARWRLAFAGIDRLLGDLGLDTAAKRALAEAARDGLGRRFAVDVQLARQLGERYREERASLASLLDPGGDAGSPLGPALAVLGRRSARVAGPATALRAEERAGRLSRPVSEIAASLAHMFTNRLLRAAAVEQELVLYDLLGRFYEARLARGLA